MELRAAHQKVHPFHAVFLFIGVAAMTTETRVAVGIRLHHAAHELLCAQRVVLPCRDIGAEAAIQRIEDIRYRDVFAV